MVPVGPDEMTETASSAARHAENPTMSDTPRAKIKIPMLLSRWSHHFVK